MTKINLLPWREARREELKQEFFANLGVIVLAAALVVGMVYLLLDKAHESQVERNNYLQTHIDALNKEVAEIAQLKERRKQLEERMNIIQGLQGNRPVIVRIFDQFVRTLPDGVYYQRLKRTNNKIDIDGTAESNNRVSSLMRRLDGSDWFSNPNLTAVTANQDFGEQANNFSLTISLASPDAAEAGEAK